MEFWAMWTAGGAVLATMWGRLRQLIQSAHLLIFDKSELWTWEVQNQAVLFSLLVHLDSTWTRVGWAAQPIVFQRMYAEKLPPYFVAPLPPTLWRPQLYRKGWKLLWITDAGTCRIELWTIRGMLDLQKIVLAGLDYCAAHLQAEQSDASNFFRVTTSYGSAGDSRSTWDGGRGDLQPGTGQGIYGDKPSSGGPATASSDNNYGILAYTAISRGHMTALNVDAAAIRAAFNPQRVTGRLAMSFEMESAREDMRQWLQSRRWYADRHIPHRRGWLMKGTPGNGKTTLIERLAGEFGIPLRKIDLASFRNSELEKLSADFGVEIHLIDDIDCVFKGRDNISGLDGSITFDAFLRWLDSQERTGSFVVLTTNRIDHIDSALTGLDGNGRPGRIDRVYNIGPPNPEGRRKVAAWIMGEDHPEYMQMLKLWDTAETNGNPPTAAQVTETCRTKALDRHWAQTDKTTA